MTPDYKIRSGNRLLRCGITTGSCAALAATAATELLLTGTAPECVSLVTPKGIRIEVCPDECRQDGETVFASVRKDAGDDPDITDGITVAASVRKIPKGIVVDGGFGIGRVTRPGLDQPVGAAAINSIPRKMITSAAEAVCAEAGYADGLEIILTIPKGKALAEKTFNPMLGIEGGISVLGTSGIVEPMSTQALLDTITLEARQIAALHGLERLIMVPGNYGMDFLASRFPQLSAVPRLKCSNYIGDALDIAALEGFREVLLIGHVGKLVKLAGGIMNTHSGNADCRRELFCAHAALCGADQVLCRQLMEQVSSDGCLSVLEQAGLRTAVMGSLLSAVQDHLNRRASGRFAVGAVLFSNEFGFLGSTPEGARMLKRWEVDI